MRTPRLLTRDLHRAFPELDIYSDEQCRRFVKAATRGVGSWWFALVYTVVAIGGLVLAVAGGAWIFNQHDDYLNRLRRDDPLVTAGAYILCALLLPIGPLAALLTRDLLLQRRVRWVLRNKSFCPACRYRLVGLPLNKDGATITCPECGHVAEVDPSLGELTLDEHGQEQYVPSVKEPVRKFWTAQRVRRTAKWAAIIIGVPLLIAGSYEAWVRWQSMRAGMLLVQLDRQIVERREDLVSGRGAPARETGAQVIADVQALTAEFDQVVTQKLPETADGRFIYPDPYVVLPQKRPGVPPDYEQVAMALARRIVTEYQKLGAFDRLDAIARCDRMRGPLDLPHDSGYLYSSRPIGLYNTLRLAMARERQDWNEYALAFETSLALIRLSADEGSAVSIMNAGLIHQAHLIELRRLLASSPPATLLDQLAAATARRAVTLSIDVTLDLECLNFKRGLAQVFSHPSNTRFGKRGVEGWEYYRTQPGIARKRLGTLSGNLSAVDALFARAKAEAAKLPAVRNGLGIFQGDTGYLLIDFSLSLVERTVDWCEGFQIDLACATIYLALERYRATYAEYPASLDQLVPEFLRNVPPDPLLRVPFGYRRISADPDGRGYLLYSLGNDGVDNGGIGPTAAFGLIGWGAQSKPEFFLAKPGEDVIFNTPLPRQP